MGGLFLLLCFFEGKSKRPETENTTQVTGILIYGPAESRNANTLKKNITTEETTTSNCAMPLRGKIMLLAAPAMPTKDRRYTSEDIA